MSSNGKIPGIGLANAVCIALALGASSVSAGPRAGSVVSGVATIDHATPGLTNVTQLTDRAIVHWDAFSIGAQETVRFQQPAASSAVLNRVTGFDTSRIDGGLVANGNVFLVNPSGIVFGKGARVDVHGLVASSLDIADGDFLAGRNRFEAAAGRTLGAVVNQGTITARDGGRVALIGSVVNNEGTIVARRGHVALAAGRKAIVDLDAGGLVSVTAPEGPAGDVVLDEAAASSLLRSAVNDRNLTEAGAVIVEGGKVRLKAAEGLAVVEGRLNADGAAGARVGTVRVLGSQAAMTAPGARITANGEGAASSGGEVRLIGTGTMLHARDAVIEAKAGESGDGGFVEVSGHGKLGLSGRVDTSGAGGGRDGEVLIDPNTLDIVAVGSVPNLDTAVGDGIVTYGEWATYDVITTGQLVTTFTGGVGTITLQATNLMRFMANLAIPAGKTLVLETSSAAGGTIQINPGVIVSGAVGSRLSVDAALDFNMDATARILMAGDASTRVDIHADRNALISDIQNTAGPVSVDTGTGWIRGVGAATHNIDSATASVLSAGGIGQAAVANWLRVKAPVVSDVRAIAGDIYIKSDSSMSVRSLIAGGPGTVKISLTANATPGTLELGDIQAASRNVYFNSWGHITSGGVAGPIIRANLLDLYADQSGAAIYTVGTALQPLVSEAAQLKITGRAAYIDNRRSVDLNYYWVPTTLELVNAGDITVTTVAGSTSALVDLTANGGSIRRGAGAPELRGSTIDLTATGGIGTLATPFLTRAASSRISASAGGDIVISTSAAAVVAAVTTPGTFKLTAAGQIAGPGGTATNIVCQTANLTAATGFDFFNPSYVSAATVYATATAGSVFLQLKTPGVVVKSASASGGQVYLNAAGDVTVESLVPGPGNTAYVFADNAGTILLGNVQSTGNFWASTDGAIGMAAVATPLVRADSLSFYATGDIGAPLAPVLSDANSLEVAPFGVLPPANAYISQAQDVDAQFSTAGTFRLVAAGDIRVNGTAGTPAGASLIDLQSTSGSILDAGAAGAFLQAPATQLTATGSAGAAAAPLRVKTGVLSATAGTDVELQVDPVAGGAVSLGLIQAGGAAHLRLAAGAADANGPLANFSGPAAQLDVQGDVGSAADPIESAAGTLAVDATGSVFLSRMGSALLDGVQAGGDLLIEATGDVVLDTLISVTGTFRLVTTGDVSVNALAGGGPAAAFIDLEAAGSIVDAGVAGARLEAGRIHLGAQGAVGALSAPVRVKAGLLSATAGSVLAVRQGDLALGGSPVSLGLIQAGSTAQLEVAGAVADGNGALANLAAPAARLTVRGDVGSAAEPIETAAGTLTATADGAVFLEQTGSVMLAGIYAGGDVVIHVAGDIGLYTVSTRGLFSLAATGDVLDAPGANTLISDGNGLNHLFAGGIIGTAADPVDVQVGSGALELHAGAASGGVSAAMAGPAMPSGTLMVADPKPPGKVMLNSVVLWPLESPVPPASPAELLLAAPAVQEQLQESVAPVQHRYDIEGIVPIIEQIQTDFGAADVGGVDGIVNVAEDERPAVGADRFGGFEDSLSYGDGAGKATPGVSRAYEALVVAQSRQATRKPPLIVPVDAGSAAPQPEVRASPRKPAEASGSRARR